MDLSNLFSRQRFDSSERHVSFRYLSLTSKLNVLHRAAIKFYDFPRTFASPLFARKGKKVRYSRRKNRFRAVNCRRFQNSIPGRLSLLWNGTRLTRMCASIEYILVAILSHIAEKRQLFTTYRPRI